MARFQECIHSLKHHEVHTSTLALFGGIQLHIHGQGFRWMFEHLRLSTGDRQMYEI